MGGRDIFPQKKSLKAYFQKTLFKPEAFLCCFFCARQKTLAQDYRINDRTQVFIEETAGDSLMIKFCNVYPAPVSVKLNW